MNRRALVVLLLLTACAHTDKVTQVKLDQALQRLADLQKQNNDLADALGTIGGRIDRLEDGRDATMLKLDQVIARVDAVAAHPGAQLPPPPRPLEPDPLLTYSVPIAGSPVDGKDAAKVTLVEFTDFACPFCMRSRATLDQLKQKYGDDLRVVHKDLIVHPQVATDAALAACAAGKQGRWFEMAHLFWSKGWENDHMKDISLGAAQLFAAGLGLDMDRFKKDEAGGDCRKRISDDAALAGLLGVHGTPAFYINGRFLSGAQPVDVFIRLIDEEKDKADVAKLKGAAYYDSLVASGKKSVN